MPLVTWNQSLSVGVETFDTQHQKLIDMLNELHDAMKSGKGNDVTSSILNRLTIYTVSHFSAEEAKMSLFSYPLMAQHKKEHADLVAQIKDFQKKFLAGEAGLSIQLMNFLRDWLVNHISGTDMKYKTFFVEKGVE